MSEDVGRVGEIIYGYHILIPLSTYAQYSETKGLVEVD